MALFKSSECIRTPLLAVDAIVLLDGRIALIKRANQPFKGSFALPGGFVEIGESVECAVQREVKEETGLDFKPDRLVGVYSDPSRDPRGHVVSVCFIGEGTGGLRSGSDAKDAALFSLEDLPPLAFDHGRIISDAFLGESVQPFSHSIDKQPYCSVSEADKE
jgi:8-oxo-dGTP diphosphatase